MSIILGNTYYLHYFIIEVLGKIPYGNQAMILFCNGFSVEKERWLHQLSRYSGNSVELRRLGLYGKDP